MKTSHIYPLATAFGIDFNNIHLEYLGYTISIASHLRDSKEKDIKEIAILHNMEYTVVANFDNSLESLTKALQVTKDEIEDLVAAHTFDNQE